MVEPCGFCGGSGRTSPRATIEDLHRYRNESNEAPEDIFSLAKTVASACRKPRMKLHQKERLEISYGFLGRKTRVDYVDKEVESDYWVLSTKDGFEKRFGEARSRDATVQEEESFETAFCLSLDGALVKLSRANEMVLWADGSFGSGITFEYFGWKDWKMTPIRDLDEFMIDFDFEGYQTVETSGLWHTRTSVVGKIYVYNGPHFQTHNLRRIYPKGVGLYLALKGLIE